MKEIMNTSRPTLFAALLSINFLLMSCSSYKSSISKGDKFYQKQEYSAANSYYLKAQEQRPELVLPYEHRASKLSAIGQWNDAIVDIKKAALMAANISEKNRLTQLHEAYTVAYLQKQKHRNVFNKAAYLWALDALYTIEHNPHKTKQNDKILSELKTYFAIELAQDALQNRNYELAFSYLDYPNFQNEKNTEIVAQIFSGIANSYLLKGDQTKALYYFSRLNDLSGTTIDSELKTIYEHFATENFNAHQYPSALTFVNQLLDLSNQKQGLVLKDKILTAYATSEINNAENTKNTKARGHHFQKALLLTQQKQQPETSRVNQLYYQIGLVANSQKQYDNSLNYLDQIIPAYQTKAVINLKIDNLYHSAKILFNEKDYTASLNHLNKILVQFPEHAQAHQLKAEIRKLNSEVNLSLGLSLLEQHQYDLSEYFLTDSFRLNNAFEPKAQVALADLYEKTYLFEKAIESLERYRHTSRNYDEILITPDNLNYKLAQLLSLKGDLEQAMQQLNNLFCSSNYQDYRTHAAMNSMFYNLRNDDLFNLWLNNKQRVKIQFHSFTNGADLDWGLGTVDPRIIAETRSQTVWSPVYKESENKYFSELYFIQDFERKETINITLEDYDKDEAFRGENEKIGSFSTSSTCNSGNYTTNLYLDGNFHGNLSYSIHPSTQETGRSNLYNNSDPVFVYPPRSYYQSCLGILFNSGFEFMKAELSYYPFLFASTVQLLADSSQEATEDRFHEVSYKYLETRYASEDFKFAVKRFTQASIIINTLKDLDENDCI